MDFFVKKFILSHFFFIINFILSPLKVERGSLNVGCRKLNLIHDRKFCWDPF